MWNKPIGVILMKVTAMVILIALGIMYIVSTKEAMDIAQTERQQVICPSFLSIARSPRDTLIVMRNEPLCSKYVLDNLR
jgi:hypothetical protein